MAQSVVKFSGPALFVGIFIIIIIFAFYVYYPSQESEEVLVRNKLPLDPESSLMKMDESWDTTKAKLFADTSLKVQKLQANVDGNNVFYREVVPSDGATPRGTLFFLHGQAFKSETWQDLGTLHFFAKNGYRAVAVDLPGYGNTPKFSRSDDNKFMMDLKSALGMTDPVVIISPSMSGGFSVPLLIAHPEVFKGYIPVAPVGTDNVSAIKYQNVKVPTCIIYGEKDLGLGRSSLANLSKIPNSEVHELPNAGHPAYLDAPEEFHEIVLKFLNRVFAAKL